MTSRSRIRARGFTLTELMVSLVMGLVVAVAAVGLARTATTAFHEEVRTSSTEMSVRMASERLRQDLMRVAYMSTGNIGLDPKVAKYVDSAAVDAGAGPRMDRLARYGALEKLRGISITPAEAGAPTGPIPDFLDIIGNLTTDDAYVGEITTSSAGAPSTCTGIVQTVSLDPWSDAAVYALAGVNGGTTVPMATFEANTKAAFQPVPEKSFLARVTDTQGCHHFVQMCGVGRATAGERMNVYLSGPTGTVSSEAVLKPGSGATDIGTCGTGELQQVTIAPLMHVRWAIVTSTATAPSFDGGENPKTDLVRQLLDFSGAPAGPPEVIAEYAVDFKLGITVDDPRATTPSARQVVYDIEDPTKYADIYNVTSGDDSLQPPFPRLGPQRVRAVRYRIATRAAIADRPTDLPTDAGTSIARICANPACTTFARVRTLTSEVALINQASMFY